MKLIEKCLTCNRQHDVEFDPRVGIGGAISDWLTKHPGHDIRIELPTRSPKPLVTRPRARPLLGQRRILVPTRSIGDLTNYREEGTFSKADWLDFLHNADVKIAYAASAAVAITLASLAASSTLLVGRESAAIDNGNSNKYLDELWAGFFKAAASNQQVGVIQVAVVGNIDDTPTWPDVFDGTDSAETVSQQSIYDQCCKLAASIATVASASITYYFGPVAIGGLFGGPLPDQFVAFVSQSAETSTNAWSATEGDHGIKRTPVYATVA